MLKRKIVTVGEFRSNIKDELDSITDQGAQVVIKRPKAKGGNVIALSEKEFYAMEETGYLLSTEANRNHLKKSIADANAGRVHKIAIKDLWK